MMRWFIYSNVFNSSSPCLYKLNTNFTDRLHLLRYLYFERYMPREMTTMYAVWSVCAVHRRLPDPACERFIHSFLRYSAVFHNLQDQIWSSLQNNKKWPALCLLTAAAVLLHRQPKDQDGKGGDESADHHANTIGPDV